MTTSSTEATTSGPTTTESTTTGPTMTGPTMTGPTTTETSTSSSSGGDSVCGNEIVEPGEMCDDGNQMGGDGCEADCTLLPGELWWQRTIDGGDEDLDRGFDVATDDAGNIYLVATVVDPIAKKDIFIRKYDPIGVSIWTRNYDGGVNQHDQGLAIAGDEFGFMVVAGRQTQGDNGSLLWLSKCDPNGQILWQNVGEAEALIGSLAMFSQTHFIAGGSIKEGMDTNALLRRYDDQGIEMWSTVHAGASGGPDSIADVAVNDAGDIFVAGREFTDATSFDVWVARYSASGEEVWSFKVDGPESGADWAGAVAVSEEGWLVVGGRHDHGDASLGDAWLARYSLDGGEAVWTQSYNGAASGDDGIRGLAIDDSGEIVAVGFEEVIDQGSNIWIRKYESSGAEIWARTIDGEGSGDDSAAAVAIDAEGNVVTVGEVAIIDQFDSDVLLTKQAP